jgi:hypothetical protein
MDADLNPRDPRVTEIRAASEHVPLQASFMFRCTSERWDEQYIKREVLGVNLAQGDVAICGYGANPQTSVDVRGASTFEERQAVAETIGKRCFGPTAWTPFGADLRSGYAAYELAELGGEGKAFANPDGHWSFPTKSKSDFEEAARMVQLAPASLQKKIRLYLMGRAKQENWRIPINWSSDGSARAAHKLRVVDIDKELREINVLRARKPNWGSRATVENDSLESCGLCLGSGTIRENKRLCPDCKGTGKIAKKVESKARSKDYNAIQRREEAELEALRR